MNSRTNHDGDLDPILRYAPPRARAQDQSPPESAVPPIDRPSPSQPSNSAEFSGDRAIVEMRQRRALEPEWVPEPPQDAAPRRELWTLALRASGVFGIAALLAWVFVFVPSVTQIVRTAFSGISASTDSRVSVPPSDMMAGASVASSPLTVEAPPEPSNRTVAAAEPPAPQAKERPDPSEQRGPATSAGAASIQAPTDLQTYPDEQTRPAPTPEANAAAQQTAPDFVTRHIDPDELAAMLRRADDFIKSGDLSSARLLLQRAVEAGSMQAALTLAGTFDPNVFAAHGIQDGAADIAMARLWYERAEQLGSSEAPRRLQQLTSNSLQ
jgi:hypothetical protein